MSSGVEIDNELVVDRAEIVLGERIDFRCGCEIYLGTFRGQDVEIMVRCEKVESARSEEYWIQSIKAMAEIRHPAIMRVIGFCPNRMVLFPLLQDSVLGAVASSHDWWNPTQNAITIAGIAMGMTYAHSRNEIHGDLRPDWVRLDAEHRPVITGFRFTHTTEVEMSMSTGNPFYLAPELYDGSKGPHTNKVDVFSFAVLLREMAYEGKAEWQLDDGRDKRKPINCSQVMMRIVRGARWVIPEYVCDFTRRLIQRCWEHDPDKRPSFADIFQELADAEFRVFDNVDSAAVRDYVEYVRRQVHE